MRPESLEDGFLSSGLTVSRSRRLKRGFLRLECGFTASRSRRLERSFSRIGDVDEDVGHGPVELYTKGCYTFED